MEIRILLWDKGMTQENPSDNETFDQRPVWDVGQVKGTPGGKALQGRDQQRSEMAVDLTFKGMRKFLVC